MSYSSCGINRIASATAVIITVALAAFIVGYYVRDNNFMIFNFTTAKINDTDSNQKKKKKVVDHIHSHSHSHRPLKLRLRRKLLQSFKHDITSSLQAIDQKVHEVILHDEFSMKLLHAASMVRDENYDESIHLLETCISSYIDDSCDGLNVYQTYSMLGDIYQKKGDHHRALTNYIHCLKIKLSSVGDSHPEVARLYEDIADLYNEVGNHDQSLQYYQRCLQVKLITLGDSHTDVARLYNDIAVVSNVMGNREEAMCYYNKSLSICLDALGENHQNTIQVRRNIEALHLPAAEEPVMTNCTDPSHPHSPD